MFILLCTLSSYEATIFLRKGSFVLFYFILFYFTSLFFSMCIVIKGIFYD